MVLKFGSYKGCCQIYGRVKGFGARVRVRGKALVSELGLAQRFGVRVRVPSQV